MGKLDETTRKEIAERLGHILCNTFVLYVKTLNFHWNMVGPQFFMYHTLLQKQYEEMSEAIDEVAEQVRKRGHRPPSSMQEFLSIADLKESTGKIGQDEMVKELISDHETAVSHLREHIAYMDEVLDQGASDMLVERIRFHDTQAWLLRSHGTSAS